MNNKKKFVGLIQKVDINIKRKFRLLERTKSNIIPKEWSIKYNETKKYLIKFFFAIHLI